MESKLEVLVAAMNQNDFSLVKKMNIKTDVVIANQCNNNNIQIDDIDGNKVKMISTNTRGVGLNRNIAINFSSGDILLFADEDMIYEDDMKECILKAFHELPKADVILFGTRFSKNNEIYKIRTSKTKKCPFNKSLKYGTYAIAIRRKTLLKYHLNFSELFGGGCAYLHGEDSDFIVNCYKRKLKIYTYDYILGTTKKDTSTCFIGYDKNYFYDTGALAKHSFSSFAPLYILYMAVRTKKIATIPFKERIEYMIYGYRNFKNIISFKEWVKLNEN